MSQDRISRMESRLREGLEPTLLRIRDDSSLHAGHAGARGGLGHYAVAIESPRFAGLTALRRHRLVYEVLGDLMRTDIHALIIEAHAPGENASSLDRPTT